MANMFKVRAREVYFKGKGGNLKGDLCAVDENSRGESPNLKRLVHEGMQAHCSPIHLKVRKPVLVLGNKEGKWCREYIGHFRVHGGGEVTSDDRNDGSDEQPLSPGHDRVHRSDDCAKGLKGDLVRRKRR